MAATRRWNGLVNDQADAAVPAVRSQFHAQQGKSMVDEGSPRANTGSSSSEQDAFLDNHKEGAERSHETGVFNDVIKKLAERKAQSMRVVKDRAAERLSSRKRKMLSIVSFILYLSFIVVYFAVALSQIRVTDMYSLQSGLKDYINTKGPDGVMFETISSMGAMWSWMQNNLLNLLFPEQVWYNNDPLAAEDRGFILEYNKLVGGFRLRQRRIVINNTDCVASVQFQDIYPTCWPTTFVGNIETQPFGPSYETTKYEWVDDPGGGGYHISIPASADARSLAQNVMSELQTDLWTNKNTYDIGFNFVVYNGNYRMFSLVSAVITFLPTGLIQHNINFYTFRMEMYASPGDFIRLGFEILIIIFIAVFSWNEIKEMMLDNRDKLTIKQRLTNYFMSFWNYVNLALLVALFVTISSYLHLVLEPAHRNLRLEQEMLTQDQFNTLFSYGIKWKQYLQLNAACVILFLFTVFKYIAESDEYGVLVRTITRSAPNLVKFLVVFFVIAIAFTVMGLLLFGATVKEWSSLWEASQQYTVMLAENSGYDLIKGTSSVAFIFYFVFVFIVFFILVNIILAVLMDSYAALQIELEKSREDKETSERMENSILAELVMQTVRRRPLRWIFAKSLAKSPAFLTSDQMSTMLEAPELASLISVRYPIPTVLNPHPAPMEILYLDDLSSVHGLDNALFIMNQLGEVVEESQSELELTPKEYKDMTEAGAHGAQMQMLDRTSSLTRSSKVAAVGSRRWHNAAQSLSRENSLQPNAASPILQELSSQVANLTKQNTEMQQRMDKLLAMLSTSQDAVIVPSPPGSTMPQ